MAAACADLIFTAGNFLIFQGGPLPGDEPIASVRLDQYLNAIGEGIVIPGQAKYASIFNVSGSEVNALARLQYESFESFREQREGAAGLRCAQSSLFGSGATASIVPLSSHAAARVFVMVPYLRMFLCRSSIRCGGSSVTTRSE